MHFPFYWPMIDDSMSWTWFFRQTDKTSASFQCTIIENWNTAFEKRYFWGNPYCLKGLNGTAIKKITFYSFVASLREDTHKKKEDTHKKSVFLVVGPLRVQGG